ncbi:MAG: MAPEG family protein [Pelagimonas sp.]|uniref:MAPEG family protein n=1 Tax=Pelagimonas sp. TaxID=2073170 RepID=UPI003D6A5F24
MVYWIFVVLLTFFVQCMLAPIVRYLLNAKGSVKIALGPRDNQPDMPVLGGRFDRALRNLMEALPIFLTLALLAEQKGVAGGITELGAAIFAVARIVYVPAYVSGIPGLRSVVWMVGSAGLIAMVVGIWPHI